MDSTTSPKVKTTKKTKVGACSLAHNTLEVERCVGAPRWGLGRVTINSIIHIDLLKPNNRLVNA